MRRLRDTWRRERRRRPAAARLAVVAVGSIAVAVALAAAGLFLLAQLVGGLALVPLTLAVYLCLIPVEWSPDDEGDEGGGPRRGGRDRGGPRGPGGPAVDVDWGRFEADFWAYVDERPAIPA